MTKTNYIFLKTITLGMMLILGANQLSAQSVNNGIFFQAVARDNFSNPAKERKIYVQSSVIQTTTNGTSLLVEQFQVNTDGTGMFSISIGNGTRVGGTVTGLNAINWSQGPFFLNLKIAITPAAGNVGWDYTKEWVNIGTTSFGAVPYALYAGTAAGVDQKVNITDTVKMLSTYAKVTAVKILETSLGTKLTATDTLNMLAPYARIVQTIDTAFLKSQLATKLDKVTGKELSTNDYTTAEKTKLAAITGSNTGDQDLSAYATNIKVDQISTDVTSAFALKANLASPTFTGTVSGITKTMVGLANVDNTTDAAKPISTLTQTALDLKSNASDVTTSLALKANLASPTFTGTAMAPTATAGTNTTQIATTAFVTGAITTANATNANLTGPVTSLGNATAIANGAITNAMLANGAVANLSGTNTGDQTTITGNAGTVTNGVYTVGDQTIAGTKFFNKDIVVNSVVIGKGGNTLADNIAIGNGARSGNINTGGNANIAIGTDAQKNNTGFYNVSVGNVNLVNGSGDENTALGYTVMANNTSGMRNTGVGLFSFYQNTTGNYNTAIGHGSLGVNTTGSYNTALGTSADVATNNLTNATAIGYGASVDASNSIQLGNTSVTNVKTSGTITADAVTYPKAHGTNGQVLSTTGSGTLAWITPSTTATAYSGTLSVANGGTGSATKNFVDLTTNQTITGVKTFSSDITVNGVKIGRGTGNNGENVAVGADALASGTGTRNTAIGYGAMRQYSGTSFDNNTSVGYFNLPALTTGSGNTSIGAESMMALTTGTENTSIGNQSLINTTGNNNVGVGKRAGQTITTGSKNTIIGTDADVATAAITNASAIGYGASVSASNTIQLGNADITNVKTSGTLTAGSVTYPKVDGSNGQVLTTNGSGVASWSSPSILYQKTHGDISLSNTVGNMISLNLPAGSYLVSYTGMAYRRGNNEYVASRIAITNPGNMGGADAIMVNQDVNDGRAYIVHQLGITLASPGSVSVFANTLYGTSGTTILTGARLTAVQVGAVIDQ